MTRGALVGLLAISAMWWLPPLLTFLEGRRYRPTTTPRYGANPYRPYQSARGDHHAPPTHVTPTQVRVRGTLLRPGRELDRGDR